MAPTVSLRSVLCAAFLVLASFVSSACVTLRDATRNVVIVNGMDRPLVVYTFDKDPRFAKRLAPGERWTDTWMYPLSSDDKRRALVEANDETGLLVFCERYSFDDLARLSARIEIRERHVNCD
jgi:hypothetical protein